MIPMDDEIKTALSFGKKDDIRSMLVKALCDELLASFQYWTCYQMSRGKGKSDCDPEFKQHSEEEHDHAEKLMLRINELDGFPISNPAFWEANSPFGFIPIETTNVTDMLKTTIDAERNAISYYKQIIEASANGIDPTTHRLAKSILSDEEEHLYDLKRLLEEQES